MADFLKLIRDRTSWRAGLDLQRTIESGDLEKILTAASWAPTAHNMQNFEVVVVDDPVLVKALGAMKPPFSRIFIQENFDQLSFTEEAFFRKKTGVLATRFPPAWANPDATDAELTATERPLPTSPTMLFLVYDPARRAPASEGDFLGIISLGTVTQNLWLAAEALGIGVHIVSSYAGGPAEAAVKKLLGIPERLRLVYAFRLGYKTAPASQELRVRRDVADFTYSNCYGTKKGG